MNSEDNDSNLLEKLDNMNGPISSSPPIAIDPEHPMFYAELFCKNPRLASRPLPLDKGFCPHIPDIQNVDDPHLQTLLDVVADISLCQRKNVSATMIRLTENRGSLETQLFVAFNHKDDQAASSCSQHLARIFKILRQIPYKPSTSDGKIICEEVESNVVGISKVLHDYSFEIFAYRVNKHLPSLPNIRRRIEQDRTYFNSMKRSKLLFFLRDLELIIWAVAAAKATKNFPAEDIKMLLMIYEVWREQNLLPNDVLADTSVTLLDEADAWLEKEHGIGFQLRRWALKIMSFVISTNRLFTLTQSRRLHKFFEGEFSVFVLDSATTTPYRCDLSSATVRRALDAALVGTVYMSKKWDAERESFVEQLQQESAVVRRAPRIHAELALIIAMAKGEIKDVMPYIGVSKLSCIMCSHYIQTYNVIMDEEISTKGSHGKAYPAWFWPILPDHDRELCQAFIGEIRLQLRDDFLHHVKNRKCVRQKSDSTVGSGGPDLKLGATWEKIEAWRKLPTSLRPSDNT